MRTCNQGSTSSMSPVAVVDIPEDFLCPISRQVMQDPVTIESGMTFDRESIDEWFTCGKRTCPLTRQPVDPCILEPNDKLLHSIREWRRKQDDGFVFIELSSSPVEVLKGHFLLPARNGYNKPSPVILAQQLESSRTSVGQLHVLQQLLSLATVSQHHKLEIATAGVLPTLMNFIFMTSGRVRWYATDLISFLTLNSSTTTTILDALYANVPWVGTQMRRYGKRQTVRSLVCCLSSPNSQTCATAAWCLWILSVQVKVRRRLATKKAVKALDALLKAQDDNVRIAAAHCVRSLATVKAALWLLKKSQVLVQLHIMLKSDNLEVQLAACCALSNMTFALKRAPKKHKGMLPGVELLPQIRVLLEMNDPCAQRAAATFLRSMVIDQDIIPEVVHSGCFRALLCLLSHDSDPTVSCAAGTLRLLAAHSNDHIKQVICSSGALPLLAALLCTAKANIQTVAAKTLGDLAIPGTAQSFMQPDVFNALLSLLRCPSERLQYNAASVLLNVCLVTDCGFDSLVVDEFAALRSLIKLLSSSNVEYQYVAAALLKHLALLDTNRMYIVKVGGLHALLDTLSQHAGKGLVGSECAEALLLIALAGEYYRSEIAKACEDGADLPDVLVGVVTEVADT